MIQIIIKQAQRKIQDSERKIQIYQSINESGALDFEIKREQSNIKQLQSMIQEISGEMERVEVAHV